jgi:hypothetical protein
MLELRYRIVCYGLEGDNETVVLDSTARAFDPVQVGIVGVGVDPALDDAGDHRAEVDLDAHVLEAAVRSLARARRSDAKTTQIA